MYYRPREQKRSPFITFFRFLVLLILIGVLTFFVSIYLGYIDIETPTLADQFQPTPTATRPAPLYVGDGDTLFAEGKLEQALQAYEQASHIDPTLDAPYIRQSRILVYTRETAKAVERAIEAVKLNPHSAENMAYYCRALDWEGRYNEALDVCNCAIELDPTYAEGYAFLSEIYADQGDWVPARTTAQQAVDTNYQSMDAHHNMGYALEVQGRYAEAVESYENAIQLAPQLAPLYVDAGRSYYWLQDFERASDRFKQAIKLSPTDPEAYNWLGWTYYTNGEFTQAFDALEQSISVDPTFISHHRGTSAWGNLATVYYTRQNFEQTAELLPKAIELAEQRFPRRIRQVEIHLPLESLTGFETIPILRGHFTEVGNRSQSQDVAELVPIQYQASLDLDPDQSCSTAILNSLTRNQTPLIAPGQPLTVTNAFSQTTGRATLNLSNGLLALELENLPPIAPADETSGYEIQVSFWPNRVDSVGVVQPDENGRVNVNIQFEEKVLAPIEYYYTLGLSFSYMDPPLCAQAVPWLLKALEIDRSSSNPAWAGLRICPSPSSPPTPVPTFTPIPTQESQ